MIRVKELAPAAYTNDDGDAVHAALIAELARAETAVVSFAGVDAVTSSFVNSALVPLLEELGFETFKKRVRVVDATKPTIDLIKHRLNFEARRHSAA
ncbi:MAG: STAS-like domain-containing protein [Tagaea sp.]